MYQNLEFINFPNFKRIQHEINRIKKKNYLYLFILIIITSKVVYCMNKIKYPLSKFNCFKLIKS